MNWFKSSNSNFNWIELKNDLDLDHAIETSYETPILIFKHSTRCSISTMAKNRIESVKEIKYGHLYYLDLIMFRSISNRIASEFNVKHESPQILKIDKGECSYHGSHQEINWNNIPD
jgi:bacillithiol system protein YtxJ